MNLRALQDAFLSGLRDDDPALAGARVFTTPPARQTTEQRWRIYRQAYRIRLTDAIRNDYPAVERVIGPGPFASLVARYVAAVPPASHDISRAGDGLPKYLDTDPLTDELPFLPDLARFEALIAAAVVAADTAPPSRVELVARVGEIIQAPLSFAPGAAYIDSRWPLGDLWECRNQPDDDVSVVVDGRPSSVVLFRRSLAVRWRPVAGDEAKLLSALGGEASLADIADSGSFGSPEAAAPRLASLLLGLIEENVLVCSTGHSTMPTT